MQISVILPTYNERDNIGPLVASLDAVLSQEAWQSEIIVVDDNSPDGTAQVVNQFVGTAKSNVKCIVRTQERGLASAILHGIQQACGERVLVMDTDFNHDPDMAIKMLRLLDESDIVIGSRFVKGGGMQDRWRNFYSGCYNLALRLLLWMPVHDNLSGFFAIRAEKLQGLPLQSIFRGYGEYFMRLLYLAHQRGDRLLEIPVYYKLRPAGTSKSMFGNMLRDYTICALDLRLGLRKVA